MEIEDQIYLAGIGALEEVEIENDIQRRVYTYKDPFEVLTDEQFRMMYRLTKEIARDLIDELEPFITAPSRSSALTIPRKVSIICKSTFQPFPHLRSGQQLKFLFFIDTINF